MVSVVDVTGTSATAGDVFTTSGADSVVTVGSTDVVVVSFFSWLQDANTNASTTKEKIIFFIF